MTTEDAIVRLYPYAEFLRDYENGRQSVSLPRRRRSQRAATTELLIRRAQECGILPAFLVPILWRVFYAAVWAAIKYWVNEIHSDEQPEPLGLIQSEQGNSMSITQTILKWLDRGSTSPAATVTSQDALKSIRTAAIVAISTFVVSALQTAGQLDLGPYQQLAGPVIGFAIDFVRRWATDNTAK